MQTDDSLATVVLSVISIVAICALAFAWQEWLDSRFKIEKPKWRGGTAVLGLITVTIQAVLTMYFFISSTVLSLVARYGFRLFALSLICIGIGKAKYKWSILASSCIFFIINFFTVLSA